MAENSEKKALSPRERFEQDQRRRLASYAVRESDSGGRKHSEPQHPYRTCFQRDRDRIIHSSAFRRLDFKTQVFVPHQQDHFRTRLTHTIEVAQVGREIGRALRLNEDLIEAVALAHDLGHPPFGHCGEAILDELMSGSGGFEHNRQSLRVVDFLEHPYPQFRGLNLSNAVRECLAKHETRYDKSTCEKFGFSPNESAPLEGQVVDLADEIAYTSADLEDALWSGLIDVDQLRDVALWRRAWRRAELSAPNAREIHKRIRAIKMVLAIPADDAIATTLEKLKRLGIDSLASLRRAGEKCVTLSPEVRRQLDEMQEFLLASVYMHPDCLRRDEEARVILHGLFAAYTDRRETLPERYQSRIDEQGVATVVCDYIAGMTDRFCRQEYARLCG